MNFPVTVCYEDLSDVYPSIANALEARLPLRNVTLANKMGAAVAIDTLPVRVVSVRDPTVQRLEKHSASAVSWFRQPAASLVLFSCLDADDYKRNFRLQLRAMIDPETRSALAPEPVFVYVTPSGPDIDARGPARVVDAMRRELGSRRHERVARVDPGGPGEPVGGLTELIDCLKQALAASLEARIAAYVEAARRGLAALQSSQPGATFTDLYLVKDSSAGMMEAYGLLEDALREYLEVEVAFQNTSAAAVTAGGSGVPPRGRDEAEGLWSGWQACRQAVQGGDSGSSSDLGRPSQLAVRQALFANQCRLLLQLSRHGEVLERGLAFLTAMNYALGAQCEAGQGPALLREAWTFAGSISLAAEVSTQHAHQARRGEKDADAPSPPGCGGPFGGFKIGGDSWRLGELPKTGTAAGLPSPSPYLSAGGTTAISVDLASQQERNLYCLLGELYCLARSQLEALGAHAGLSPPVFAADIAAVAAKLPDPTGAAALVPTPFPSGPSDHKLTPRSSTRSGSPSRNSATDRSSITLSAAALGGGGDFESGDEATSLTIRALPRLDESPFFQPQSMHSMQTIDLTAAAATAAQEVAAGGAQPTIVEGQEEGESGELQNGGGEDAGSVAAQSPEARGVEMAPVMSSMQSSTFTGFIQRRLSLNSAQSQVGSSQQRLPPIEPDSRASPAGDVSDTESGGSSSPHKRTASAAAAAPIVDRMAPMGAAAAAAAAAVAAAAGETEAVTTPKASLVQVERLVAEICSSGNSSGGGSMHQSAGAPSTSADDALEEWKPVHWRLRHALASPSAFAALWQALSAAAAACFEEGGRKRHALLYHADVARCLAAKEQYAEAAALLEAQCKVAMLEGWGSAALVTLPQLAACQAAVLHPDLPHTATALLSLTITTLHGSTASASVTAAVSLLMRAAALPPAAAPPPSLSLAATSPRGRGGYYREDLDLSSLLIVLPEKGRYSRFYRASDAAGRPVLVPTGANKGGSEGRAEGLDEEYLHCTVGDVAAVALRVVNLLPSAVALQDVRLSLLGMQEMTVLSSPRWRPASPNPFRNSLQSPAMSVARASIGGPGSQNTPQGLTPVTAVADQQQYNTIHQQGNAFFRSDSMADEGPRYVSEWQDAEELECALAAVVQPSTGGSRKEERKKIRNVVLRPLRGPAVLQPGANLLVFAAAPLKRGLYRPSRIAATFGQLPAKLAVPSSAAAARSAAFDSPRNGSISPRGGPAFDASFPAAGGEVREEAVVLAVEPAAPRMTVSAATAAGEGGLVAGQRQWLGLHVSPGKDRLGNATLCVSWPSASLHAANSALKLNALLTGAELPLRAQSADTAVPAVVPHHAAAVVTPLGESNTTSTTSSMNGEPIASYSVVSASEAHEAAWEEEAHQEVCLPPHAVGERGAVAWWWVKAAAMAAPNEPLRVSPPGSTPASFSPQEGAGEGGLAALVDLPLSLQYHSGCRRTYVKVLTVPIHAPFAVRSTARELSSGDVVAQFMVTSTMPYAVTLSAAAFTPQPGFLLEQDVASELGLLPMRLPPKGSLSLAYLLRVDEGSVSSDRATTQLRLQQAAKGLPSALELCYSVAMKDAAAAGAGAVEGVGGSAAAAAAAAAYSGHRTSVLVDTNRGAVGAAGDADGTAATGATLLHVPGADALQSVQQAVNGGDDSDNATAAADGPLQACRFFHRCTLELSSLETEQPGAWIAAQLLGPFTATAGQPVSLCWRLERCGESSSAGQENSDEQRQPAVQPTRVHFDIVAEGEAWRPIGKRSGVVTIDPHDGALATVEATWMPLVAGTLAVPSLALADVTYHEVFEVGSGSANYIVVGAAGSGGA